MTFMLLKALPNWPKTSPFPFYNPWASGSSDSWRLSSLQLWLPIFHLNTRTILQNNWLDSTSTQQFTMSVKVLLKLVLYLLFWHADFK